MDISEKKKEPRKKKRILWYIVIVLLLLIMGFSGYKVISGLLNYHEGDKAYEDVAASAVVQEEKKVVRKIANRAKVDDPSSASEHSEASGGEPSGENSELTGELQEIEVVDLTVDFETLLGQNNDVAAWIFCEGTPINYPVVLGSNNDYYINHRFDGVYSSFGSIFIDYRQSGDFSAADTLVYGHHMDNGSMFAALLKYKNQSFYDAHPNMLLYTPDGDYLLELFAGYTAATDDYCYTYALWGGDFDALITHAKALSTFQSSVTPAASDRIVTLSTCAYDFKDARYVVLGVLTPLE